MKILAEWKFQICCLALHLVGICFIHYIFWSVPDSMVSYVKSCLPLCSLMCRTQEALLTNILNLNFARLYRPHFWYFNPLLYVIQSVVKQPYVSFITPPEHRVLFSDLVGARNIYAKINSQTTNCQSPYNLYWYRWTSMCYCRNVNVVFILKKKNRNAKLISKSE